MLGGAPRGFQWDKCVRNVLGGHLELQSPPGLSSAPPGPKADKRRLWVISDNGLV